MSQEYPVTVILGVKDNGFSSAMENANSATQSLGAKVKSGLGFGALAGIGNKAVNLIGSSLRGLVSDLNSTTSSWSSFTKNMEMSGMKSAEIEKTKADLQDFAKKTVYTSKDMASTYAQLYAVNDKTTTALVKGFGAVAAAAENPTQAMKTLSTQATQMAAKPTVQWQDFKLMLEQTPAGISKVAKAMNMSTSELVANVQDGKIATQDFFDAMEKLASDPDLMSMATTYKTIGEAADGLSATLSTGLAPAWEIVNEIGISAVSGLMTMVSKGTKKLQKIFKGVGSQFKSTASEVGKLMTTLSQNKNIIEVLENLARALASTLKYASKCTELLAKGLNKLLTVFPDFPAFAAGLITVNGLFKKMTGAGFLTTAVKKFMSFKKVTEAVGETVPDATEAVGKATESAGKKTAKSGSKFAQAAKGFLALGAAVVMIGAGFGLLAQAAIALANSGGLAIGVFAGMIVSIGALVVLFAHFGTALTTAAPAMLSFGGTVALIGAGIALIGVGIYAACAGLVKLSGALPAIAKNGASAGAGIFALASGLGALVTVVALAGVVLVALGAFSSVAVVGIGVLAVAGAAVVIVMAAFALACKTVKTQVKGIASAATTAAKQLKAMVSSVSIVKEGLKALGSLASGAINKLKSAFSGSAGALKSSATAMGQAVSSGLQSGLNSASLHATTAVNHIKAALNKGVSAARTVGINIGKGLANGILAEIPSIKAAAAKASSAATVKMKKVTDEHSPSRVTQKIGAYLSQGLIIGMESEKRNISRVSGKLAELATYSPSRLSYAGDYSLNDSWDYSSTANYQITVVSELDGKVVSRQLAPTMQQEQNRLSTRTNRKRGVR